jgi:TolB-like protein/Flp pilus assembly protein TadD
MKRCPHCHRLESDDALAFCRVDGTPLVDDAAAALNLSSTPAGSEVVTSILPHVNDAAIDPPTAPTTVLEPKETRGRIHESGKPAWRKTLVAVLAAVLLASLAFSAYVYVSRNNNTTIDSIAVLPFQNSSSDSNSEYLSDGVSEALINSLTELQQLKVIARSTVFRYKGKQVDPQTVGRELNVRALLMGRVRETGDNLNIQVDLVDAKTGAQLWGHEYESKTSDVLSVKQSIAREVTDKLRLRLSGDEKHQLAKRDTSNAESFQCYLRGRYYWNKRSAEGIKKAIEQFQEAIDHDPNYALGYVGLADSYLALELYAGLPASEVVPKARAAADRALQLDDSLSEAHATSAFINQKLWRWPEAEQELKRAISLNPNYPTAHHWYAYYFYITRNFDGASSEIKLAYELDPLSPVISENVALVYLLKNDLKAAIEQCLRTIELDPNFADAHYVLGFAYLKAGRIEEATAEFQKSVDLSGRASTYLGNLGYCYAVTGRQAEALTILKELEEKYTQGKSSAQFLAGVYAGLSEKDQAFAWLEKDFQQRSGQLPTIAWRLHFGGLRSDPRYQDLLRRMGLNP